MKRIVIGVSGASGVILAVRLLEACKAFEDVETHVVVSDAAKRTLLLETSISWETFTQLCDVIYDNSNIGASIASGSFPVDGMVVVPCSMKSVAGVAHGFSDSLLLRAADVAIKEKRKLILVPRETPMSPIHLSNLTSLSQLQNVWIMPPMLTYYNQPNCIEDMEHHLIAKILEKFDLEVSGYQRWKG
ncbi:MAG: UbiX family flavin prenyltransferase [Erysipelotrichaceae bacterium]